MSFRVETDQGQNFEAPDLNSLSQWLQENRIRDYWMATDSETGSRKPIKEWLGITGAPAAAPPSSAGPASPTMSGPGAPGPGSPGAAPPRPGMPGPGTQGQVAPGQVAPGPGMTGQAAPRQGASAAGGLFVIHPSGKRYGPLTHQTLAQWVSEGRIMPEWLVQDPNSSRQRKVSEVLQDSGMPGPAVYPRGVYNPVSNSAKALSTWSIVLGAISILLMCFATISGIIGLAGLTTGILAKRADRSQGLPGIILSAIGLVLAIVIRVSALVFLNSWTSSLRH